MSEIKYGLISRTDADTLEKTIDLIVDEFPNDVVLDITEIGVYAGETMNGIQQYVESKGKQVFKTGIDNDDNEEPIRFHYHELIIGNSNEVYNRLQDESQHAIIIDGNHSYPYVLMDFFCYEKKLKRNGYLLFHDSAPQAQGKDWQRMGSKDDTDMSISVVKVLIELGFIHPEFRFHPQVKSWRNGWQMIFDEYDPNDECGGFFVVKKVF